MTEAVMAARPAVAVVVMAAHHGEQRPGDRLLLVAERIVERLQHGGELLHLLGALSHVLAHLLDALGQ
jgi:hypothetical protein